MELHDKQMERRAAEKNSILKKRKRRDVMAAAEEQKDQVQEQVMLPMKKAKMAQPAPTTAFPSHVYKSLFDTQPSD